MRTDKFGIGRCKPAPAINAEWIERDEEHPDAEAVADRIRQWLRDREDNPITGQPPE